ncbi:YeiH family protein [Mesobacillus campisalis]
MRQLGAEKILYLEPMGEPEQKRDYRGYAIGILVTFVFAVIAGQIAALPFFSIMGIMILSILLGALWGNIVALPKSLNIGLGTNFSSKFLLRAGIILLGFRLNFADISSAGPSILIIDALVISFTMIFILSLGKAFQIDRNLAMLLAAGTAICGAAAIVAIAPIIQNKKEQTAIAVSCIAVLGTIGAVLFIFLFPYLPLNESEFGMLVGATLHELAHVVAASVPGGDAGSETAILVKLGRVILLIPVALIISFFMNRKERAHQETDRKLPIPWFIFGFLFVSLINTFQLVPEKITEVLLLLSTYLLAMGMVGLGINIKYADFVKVGIKPIGVAVIGFLGLLAITPVLLWIFRFFS